MIRRNNDEPSFKSLYTIPGFRELGAQGRMSLEITKPFLQEISQDCDIYIGAFGRKEQPKLTFYCSDLVERIPKNNFLGRVFVKTVDMYTKLSCAKAISPESMVTNAQIAKADFLVEQKGDLEKVVELEGMFQEFAQSQDYLKQKARYDASFLTVPTKEELKVDRVLSSFTIIMPVQKLKTRELVKH